METNKILTVAVPTYNMERYLGRCLDSLILPKELMERLEVLVVNDGSKDKSSQIAHEYENRFPLTFRVIDKQNGNYGSCVNRALDEAKGKYFRILDADDRFNPETFPTFIRELSKADADMVLTHHYFTYDWSKKKIKKRKRSDKIDYGKVYDASDFDFEELECADTLLLMHSVTYKLDILKKVGLRHQTGIGYTDIEYVYFPLVAVKTILPIDIYLYAYTLGREGQTISLSAFNKSNEAHFLIARRMLDDFINCELNKTDKHLYRKQAILIDSRVLSSIHLMLCLSKRDPIHEDRLKAMYEDIKKYIPEILPTLRKDKYKHMIHYFRVWEKNGKFMSDFPYYILGNSIDWIKRLIPKVH